MTKTAIIPIEFEFADISELMAGKTLAFLYGEHVEVRITLKQ